MNIKLEQLQLKDLANRIITSGIVESHKGSHLMNESAEHFHFRLKNHFPPEWDLFLRKHGARFVGFIGEYAIKEVLLKVPFVIKLQGDEGKDIEVDGKWWDIKTGFSSSPMLMANSIRHAETYGYIFCHYDPPDVLRIIQTNTAEEVWQESNFKKAGTELKWRPLKFDAYIPPDKTNKRWDGKSSKDGELEKFFGLK